MKTYKIVFKNIAGALRNTSYRAATELEAINKLLHTNRSQVQSIVSVTEITLTQLSTDESWNAYLKR